jgi:hypothetical protein
MLSLAKFVKKEIQLRENLVGAKYLGPPTRKVEKNPSRSSSKRRLPAPSRVTVIGEIVSAKNFDAEDLYIRYNVFMPVGWSFEEENEYEAGGMLRDD